MEHLEWKQFPPGINKAYLILILGNASLNKWVLSSDFKVDREFEFLMFSGRVPEGWGSRRKGSVTQGPVCFTFARPWSLQYQSYCVYLADYYTSCSWVMNTSNCDTFPFLFCQHSRPSSGSKLYYKWQCLAGQYVVICNNYVVLSIISHF